MSTCQSGKQPGSDKVLLSHASFEKKKQYTRLVSFFKEFYGALLQICMIQTILKSLSEIMYLDLAGGPHLLM